MLANIIIVIALFLCAPWAINFLIPYALMFAFYVWVSGLYARTVGKYIPTPIDDKKLMRSVWYVSYGWQRERRGVFWGLWWFMVLATILTTGVSEEPIVIVIMWAVVVVTFLMFRWKHKHFPPSRPLPGRQRR